MTLEHTGWRKAIVDMDNKLPLILPGVMLGMILYTVGELVHWHGPHIFHTPTVHAISNEWLIWVFFAYLGMEISVSKLIRAGKFAGMATLGGVIVPPLIAYVLTHNWYIAAGAMATDVAFSLGAMKVITKGKAGVFALLGISLMILAVGDDMGGVAALAGIYAKPNMAWLTVEVLVLLIAFFAGERGVMNFRWRSVDDEGKPGKTNRIQWVIEINSPVFWVILGILNSFVLKFAGVEWILGGCLVFIFAPHNVKHKLIHLVEPVVPIVLFFFGMVNGAIDILDGGAWTWLTFGCVAGGMFGKQIGIFGGGLIGRWLSRGTKFGNVPTSQIYALALWGSCNGTVAIFFVAMAAKAGVITTEMAAQATLGYFLTVPLVYAQTFVFKATGLLKDVPEFQPEPDEAPLHEPEELAAT